MGGGGSFSAGGPGKGMHSRLCRHLFKSYLSRSCENMHLFFIYPNMIIDPVPTDLRILNKYEQVESFSAFNSVYNNSGLFGIYTVTVSITSSIV